jgi:hypothetical protein
MAGTGRKSTKKLKNLKGRKVEPRKADKVKGGIVRKFR